MLSDVFIRRPVLATVCSLLIILAGAVSIPTLPIARYPDLTPPAVTVNAFYTVREAARGRVIPAWRARGGRTRR